MDSYGAIASDTGRITVTGGTLHSTQGSALYIGGDSPLCITGGTIYTKSTNRNYPTIDICTTNSAYFYSLEVGGEGTVYSTGNSVSAIRTYGNMLVTGSCDIHVKGSSTVVIEALGSARVTVNGGSVRASATSGIGILAIKTTSTVTVRDGTVTAIGTAINGNGTVQITGGTV